MSELEQSFDTVRPAPAEKKERPFFKRVLLIPVPDDHGKSVDPLAQVYGPACQDNAADSCMAFKHGTPPAGWQKAACRKCCLLFRS